MGKIRNHLGKIVAAALTIPFVTGGCDNKDSEYYFHGSIDGEEITFFENQNHYSQNVLLVKKSDEKKIVEYYETCHFGHAGTRERLNKVCIIADSVKDCYVNDSVGEKVLKEANKQYKDYLNKILQFKKKQGMNLINE